VKHPGKLLKVISLIVAAVIVLAGLVLAGFALIPPTPIKPELRDLPDQSAFALDEKVGWYQMDDGSYRMVTWASYGGLTINDFAAVKRGHLAPRTADAFTWETSGDQAEFPVAFERDTEGRVAGVHWSTPEGKERRAQRLEVYAYDQAEVRFSNGSVELVGLLMTPLSAGPHPGIVFIHGSGKSIRDYMWYSYLADYLAKHGIAVLLPDKRGCGKSGGEWLTSSFDDYARDAIAAVEILKNVPSVDPERIGLIGMSQGGFILPVAADKSTDVRFLVSFSGSATTIERTMRHEISEDMKDRGIPGWLVSVLEPVFSIRAKKWQGDFWRINGSFDPLPYWQKVSVPVLVLNGKNDKNSPVAESVARFETVQRENEDARITIRVYDGSGHGIEAPNTGAIRDDCLATIVEWINALWL
jgi:dipeptidyl aminopeptidase/acylaminoacyl peptidase